jgi:SAM-dependent methyltransferase
MKAARMRRFWDARAKEDAFYFVDNRLVYGDPDLDRFWAGGPEALEAMERRLGARVEPGHDIVEIGCGVGRLTRALRSRGRSVRALDVSAEMVDRARALNDHLDGVEFIVGDGVSLAPIGSASADVIQSDVVFQHIPDPAITLGYVREMGRVLRPGGFAMFQVSNAPEVHAQPGLAQRVRGAVRGALRRGPAGQANRAWLGSGIDLEELRRVADEAGMATERVDGEGTLGCLVLLRRGAL